MMRAYSYIGVSLGIVLVSACGTEFADDIDWSSAAILAENSLSPNALSPNALSPNALSPNALSPNALSPNALSPAALSALQDPSEAGALARQLLEYTVSCALDEGQRFTFSWNEATSGDNTGAGPIHTETYQGRLGLAPSWTWQPLDEIGQQAVSACLAAHVNHFGVSVTLSVRSALPPLARVDERELHKFPKLEGAFWGTLFGATPRMYACYEKANVGHSRHRKRICAAGRTVTDPETHKKSLAGCGAIQILGPCKEYCSKPEGHEKYYRACIDPETQVPTEQVITTALP